MAMLEAVAGVRVPLSQVPARVLWATGRTGQFDRVKLEVGEATPDALRRGILGMPLDPKDEVPPAPLTCAAFEAFVNSGK